MIEFKQRKTNVESIASLARTRPEYSIIVNKSKTRVFIYYRNSINPVAIVERGAKGELTYKGKRVRNLETVLDTLK